MKRRYPKILVPVAAAAAIAAAAIVWGGGELVARRERRVPPRIPDTAALAPATPVRPGDAVRAALEFRLPWGCAVRSANAVAGNNTVLAGAAEVDSKWRWGGRVWRVEAAIRPLGTRDLTPGKILVTLDDGRSFKAAIPVPQVISANAGELPGDPRFAAPELPPARKRSYWWWLLAAAALSAPAAYLLWRQFRRRRPATPPWEIARAELAALRSEMESPRFRPATGVGRLSDILRNYLAARFDIPAATEAGRAFLDRDAARAALAPEEREFLRNFFDAADLVKFARAAARRPMLEESVAGAEALVERTVPAPPENLKRRASS